MEIVDMGITFLFDFRSKIEKCKHFSQRAAELHIPEYPIPAHPKGWGGGDTEPFFKDL